MTRLQFNPQLKPELPTHTTKLSTRICAGGTNPIRLSFRSGGTQVYGMAGGQFHKLPAGGGQ
ncbi:hypothetical protein, partial [Streptomyces malaysiensis]